MTPREIYQLVLHRSVDLMIDGKAKTQAEAERMAVRELAPTMRATLANQKKHNPQPAETSGTGDARQELIARLDQMNTGGLQERVAQLEAGKDEPARKSIPRYRSKKSAPPVTGSREAPPRRRPRLAVIEGGASSSGYGLVRPRRAEPRYEMYLTPDGRKWLKRNFSEYDG